MKRSMSLLILLFCLFSFQPSILAAGSTTPGNSSVYDAIHSGEKTKTPDSTKVVDSPSPSVFSLFIKFIFSFVFVIVLIFFVVRFLSKRSGQLQANGPIIPLGAKVLGNNRSLQVVMIGQTIYILGVGDTITLIRSISQGEEYQHLLESYENDAEVSTLPTLPTNWLSKDQLKKWNTIFRQQLKKMQQEDSEE